MRPMIKSIMVNVQAESDQRIEFSQTPDNGAMGRRLTRPRHPVGARLAEFRKRAGYSQAELGRRIGVPQGVVAFWELTDKPPRSNVLLKLAEVLRVRVVEDLLGGRAPRVSPSGPVGRARRLFDQLARLPRRRQDRILGILEDLLGASGRNGHSRAAI